jgi:hypothetical protein
MLRGFDTGLADFWVHFRGDQKQHITPGQIYYGHTEALGTYLQKVPAVLQW